MGFDADAITIIGVKIPREQLRCIKQYSLDCRCTDNDKTKQHCSSCGNRNNQIKITHEWIDAVVERISDDDTWGSDCYYLFNKYLLYIEEFEGDEDQNYVYVILWKGERTVVRGYDINETTGTYTVPLEDLIKLRDEMKEDIVIHGTPEGSASEGGILSANDFDKNFGIYTSVSGSH